MMAIQFLFVLSLLFASSLSEVRASADNLAEDTAEGTEVCVMLTCAVSRDRVPDEFLRSQFDSLPRVRLQQLAIERGLVPEESARELTDKQLRSRLGQDEVERVYGAVDPRLRTEADMLEFLAKLVPATPAEKEETESKETD